MPFSEIISFLPILLFSVIVHEVAHGWVALKCGDPTARDAGRLTFNPIPHIDPFMTILLPAMLIYSGAGIIFGGAKPVPVNPYNFRRRERDNILVAFAGPASNLLLAMIAVVFSLIVALVFQDSISRLGLALIDFLTKIILINLILANFNLIPIPPLDGSHILAGILKGEAKQAYLKLGRYGFFIIIIILVVKRAWFFLLLKPSIELLEICIRWQISVWPYVMSLYDMVSQ